jgi:hypothetical protein
MADDAPENAGQAVRNYLGGLGFIVTLIGAELMKEGNIYGGAALVVAGLPIFLSGVLWKWLRTKLGNPAATWLSAIASDERWRIVSLLLLAGVTLLLIGPLGAALFFAFALSYAVIAFLPGRRETPAAATQPAPTSTQIDGQTRLDLLHLIDFGIDQTTIVKLERLIATSTAPETTHGSDDPDKAHQSRNFYIGWVRQNLDGDRLDMYRGLMQNAQFEAERVLRETPPDQRPPGDPLNVREHAISQLQFTQAVQFLRHQKREVEDRLISKRFQLIERRDLRNTGKT